ncbi:MAG: hypothetical protein AB7K24_19260 [Gemmataceae bacterium]
MKSLLIALAVLTVWNLSTSTSWAAWGWPPPGYSASGVKASDNSVYRGLFKRSFHQRRADRKQARQASTMTPSAAPLMEQAPEPKPIPR